MNIKISENIKRLRKEKKITQEGLAEIFNVTPAAVSKWENNETYPDITLLFPLSHFFGVSIDELMGYDYMLIEEEIKKAKKLSIVARSVYPNDYEIMVNLGIIKLLKSDIEIVKVNYTFFKIFRSSLNEDLFLCVF